MSRRINLTGELKVSVPASFAAFAIKDAMTGDGVLSFHLIPLASCGSAAVSYAYISDQRHRIRSRLSVVNTHTQHAHSYRRCRGIDRK